MPALPASSALSPPPSADTKAGETPVIRLPFVDALRGIAALMVIVFHVVQQYGRSLPRKIHDPIMMLERGVQLFYVVSAFTLFGSLYQRYGARRRVKVPWREFFLRRFFRIAPLFYAALIFYLWLYGTGPRRWQGSESAVTGYNVLSHVFFVNGFHPYWIDSIIPVEWSVAVEMLFYCTVPLLFLSIRNLNHALVLTILSALLSVGLSSALVFCSPIENEAVWNRFLSLWLVAQFPVFCSGLVLFFLLRVSWIQGLGAAKAALLMMGCASFFVLGQHSIPYLPDHLSAAILFVGFAVGLAIFPTRLIVNPVTRFLGMISFSLYLFHIVGMRLAAKCFPITEGESAEARVASILGLTLALSVIIASITYFVIERRGQQLGNWIQKRLRSGSASVSD